MSLSDEHIQRHLKEWTDLYLDGGDHRGGGHAGMSLNVFCGLLAEPPKRVAKLALALTVEYEEPTTSGWSWGGKANGNRWFRYRSVPREEYNAFLPGGYEPYIYPGEDEKFVKKTYQYFRPST